MNHYACSNDFSSSAFFLISIDVFQKPIQTTYLKRCWMASDPEKIQVSPNENVNCNLRAELETWEKEVRSSYLHSVQSNRWNSCIENIQWPHENVCQNRLNEQQLTRIRENVTCIHKQIRWAAPNEVKNLITIRLCDNQYLSTNSFCEINNARRNTLVSVRRMNLARIAFGAMHYDDWQHPFK